MRLHIEKIAAGGWGVARTPEGTVFCRAVAPGEEVEAGRLEKRRGILWAQECRVLEPSSARVEPDCPLFPLCGGCDFRHMTYGAELEAKTAATAETLRRVAGRPIPLDPLPGPDALPPPHSYRNTIRIQGGAGYLGFCRKNSVEIVDVEDCPLAQPAIRRAMPGAREEARRMQTKSVTFRAGFDSAEADPRGEPGALCVIKTSHGRTAVEGGALHLPLAGRLYRVSPRSFFQVNTEAAGRIVDHLRSALPAGPRLLDLFAGVGSFALALADRYDAVWGAEISKDAVMDFRENARGNPRVKIVAWDAFRELPEPIRPDDVVVLDPPRTGLPRILVGKLSRERPRALAYVSCDPATFARDLALLRDGGYRLAGPVRPFEMFPRTAHVELCAVMERETD